MPVIIQEFSTLQCLLTLCLSNNRINILCTNQVARLYRKSLKTLSSWVIDRECFLEEATALRARFDAERGVSNAKAIRLLKVSFDQMR